MDRRLKRLMLSNCLYGDNIFSLFLKSQDFALTCLLRDHDNDFNKQFLQYVSKAWSVWQNR